MQSFSFSTVKNVGSDGAIMSVSIKNNDFFCYLLMNLLDKMSYNW